jgi:hypothetical protein
MLFCSLSNGLSFVLLGPFSLVEDKGDGIDAEAGMLEDILRQEEIYKCRLASIKRVSCYFSD